MKRFLFSVILVVCLGGSASAQQFSWHLGNGPFDGPVYSILAHPNGTVYVGGKRLFWSSDHYGSWNELAREVNDVNATYDALALDSIHRVLVGTNRGLSVLDTASKKLIAVLSGVSISAITVAYSGDIYLLTGNGTVVRSGDSGKTWVDVSPSSAFGHFISILSDPAGYIFIGTDNEIIRSEDNGNSWQELVNGLTPGSYLSLACSLQGDLYATNSELFHSRDEGRTWTLLDSARRGASMLICSRPDGGLLEVDVNYPAVNARITTDQGASWLSVQDTLVVPGEPDEAALAVAWDPRGEWLVGDLGDDGGSTPGGILSATDKGLFFLKRGTPSADIRAMIIDESGTLFSSYSGYLFKKSTDGGMTWRVLAGQGSNPVAPQSFAIDSAGTLLYADKRQGDIGQPFIGFYRKADLDSNRLLLGNLLPNDTIGITVDHGNVYYVSSSSYGMYRSTDLGSTWDQFSAGLTHANLACVAATPWSVIYAGGGGGLFRSRDEGVTWNPVSLGIGKRLVSTILTTPQNEIFVGTDSGLFRSVDSGSTWKNVSGRSRLLIRSLVTTSLGDVMAGTDSGIFYLKKGYNVYSPLDSGLQNFSITTLQYDAKNQRFIAGTNGSSFYYGSGIIGDLTAAVNEPAQSSFSIVAYPNPFGTETQIQITLQSHAYTTLRLFDVLGQEVKVISEGALNAGVSKFNLTAADIPPGVYFLMIQADATSYTKSILVQR